ncbi:MAG: DUF2868 domain-containing protein [Gammaproteobacteria bacterium]
MTTSNFDKRLLIEQIRYMEAEHKLACDAEHAFHDLSVHSDFEDHLWQRAQYLVKRHDLSAVTGRASRLSRYARTVAVIVAALFGALGVVYAVTDTFTINIYWLLLVLLGFNFLSMLLWLIGISLNMKALTAGVLARLTSWLPGHLKSKSSASKQADRAWLNCNFSAAVGKWQFSKITHQLWLVYLFAGLAFLVLMLMLRQYDFVWGTTLLSDTVFLTLTDALSAPLQALGFATPSAEQVQDTRVGLAQTLSVEHRYRWAQFLLGALLCFGIVPRILLLAWSALMTGISRRRFRLDYYLPYYISLRQKLMPLASHGQIIDADNSPPVLSASPAKIPVPHKLPDEALWVAVELGVNINWPPLSVSAANDLGEVIDRQSLDAIQQQLQSKNGPVVAVAVSSVRAPDRGVQRVITSLMSSSEQRWLVLLQSHEHEPVSSTRLAAWYRLAEASKVPADHVISMSVA